MNADSDQGKPDPPQEIKLNCSDEVYTRLQELRVWMHQLISQIDDLKKMADAPIERIPESWVSYANAFFADKVERIEARERELEHVLKAIKQLETLCFGTKST